MPQTDGRNLHRLLLACGLAASVGGAAFAQNPQGGMRSPSFGSAPEIRAQLIPRQYTTLSSEMAGRIDTINALIGVKFNKGDLLIAFDCAIQRAQESRAQAEATRAEKALAVNNRLVQLKSSSELELEVAKAELDKAKADLAIAQAMVSKCSIVAPFSGVTVDQKARQFQYAAQGQALLDIVDNSALDVELIAPSRWLTWLKPGFTFDLRVDELNKSFPVKVTRFSGKVDPVSQSVRIIGEITVAAPDLIAGMSGRATIQSPAN